MKKLIVLFLLTANAFAAAFDLSLIPGNWISPRHEYLYRTNGTWTMLPEEPGVTHGTWFAKGNHFKSYFGNTLVFDATITKLTPTEFIAKDEEGHVQRMTRESPRKNDSAQLPAPPQRQENAVPHTPKPGSPERQAICDGARAYVLKKYVPASVKLPQPIVFKIERIEALGDYCSFLAVPRFKDGSEISTEYIMDVAFNLCLKKTGDTWRVVYDLS